MLVKDNIDAKGLHITAGSLALADNIAREDAPVIRNMRRNGVIILGKTNMTEFANYTTEGDPGLLKLWYIHGLSCNKMLPVC